MNTIEDFILLLDEEMGLPVTADDIGRHLDAVSAWDSLHMLSLLTLLERRTGRSISLPDALEAESLHDIYALAVAS